MKGIRIAFEWGCRFLALILHPSAHPSPSEVYRGRLLGISRFSSASLQELPLALCDLPACFPPLGCQHDDGHGEDHADFDAQDEHPMAVEKRPSAPPWPLKAAATIRKTVKINSRKHATNTCVHGLRRCLIARVDCAQLLLLSLSLLFNGAEPIEIVVGHHADEFGEGHPRPPAEHATRLRRVAAHALDVRRPKQERIAGGVCGPVEAQVGETRLRRIRGPNAFRRWQSRSRPAGPAAA